MKNVLRGIFLTMIIGIAFISLTGCGKKDDIYSDADKIIKQVEKDYQKSIENNQSKKENKTNETKNEDDDIKLVSDDTKIVFNVQDVYYLIYYHNGNEITGLEHIYDYQDEETAKYVGAAIKTGYLEQEDVEKAEIKGTKLRIVYKKSAYEGETLESIKQTYSYLKEIQEN